MGGQAAILEAFVPFEREVSVVAARGVDGAFAAFPLVENRHANHILDVTIAPAQVSPEIAAEAEALNPSPDGRAGRGGRSGRGVLPAAGSRSGWTRRYMTRSRTSFMPLAGC
jgi:hypothetical protein